MSTELNTTVCPHCHGAGYVPRSAVVNCPICHGNGRFLDSPCLGCGGCGTVEIDDEVACPCCESKLTHSGQIG